VIFSDLDGTLLDHETYDWTPARPALEALAAQGIPLVLCSSKTRAEMRQLARAMALDMPLIVENGGGVWLPRSWAGDRPADASDVGDGWLVTLGTPTDALRPALARIAEAVATPLRGFGAMTVEEVAERTGLPRDVAALAWQREFSEPFVAEGAPPSLARLDAAAREHGLQVTQGGRFFHLIGPSDKGRAVRTVRDWTSGAPSGETLGLGDAPNDLALLRAVDTPVIVPRPDGHAHPDVLTALPHARVAPAPGPTGWNAAVLRWLEESRIADRGTRTEDGKSRKP